MRMFLIGLFFGAAFSTASISLLFAAGKVKYESQSNDAGSTVAYGTSDAGDSIVRFKTTADGTLVIS